MHVQRIVKLPYVPHNQAELEALEAIQASSNLREISKAWKLSVQAALAKVKRLVQLQALELQ